MCSQDYPLAFCTLLICSSLHKCEKHGSENLKSEHSIKCANIFHQPTLIEVPYDKKHGYGLEEKFKKY